MSDTVASELATLQADVATLTSQVADLKTEAVTANSTISGFASALAAAIAGSTAAGLTPEQLQAFTDLHAAISGAASDVGSTTASLQSTISANPLPASTTPTP